jgi:hypothetical protein
MNFNVILYRENISVSSLGIFVFHHINHCMKCFIELQYFCSKYTSYCVCIFVATSNTRAVLMLHVFVGSSGDCYVSLHSLVPPSGRYCMQIASLDRHINIVSIVISIFYSKSQIRVHFPCYLVPPVIPQSLSVDTRSPCDARE